MRCHRREGPDSRRDRGEKAGSDIEVCTDHGTACAETVYDIAPHAEFYLANFGTEVELGNVINWLRNTAKVDVIFCSIVGQISGPNFISIGGN